MVKFYARINSLNMRSVHLSIFLKEEFDRCTGWNPYATAISNLNYNYLKNKVRISYDDKIIDDLLENMNNICEVEVLNGKLIKVKHYMTYNELEATSDKIETAMLKLDLKRGQ